MPSVSPTVRRRRLGSELRRLRDQAGLSTSALAKQIATSQTKLSAVEGARRALTDAQMHELLGTLAVEDHKRAELLELHTQGGEPGWWDPYSDLLTDVLELLIGLEAGASWIRRYDEGFIPALLQTPAYARATALAHAPFQRTADTDHAVDFRMQRKSRLDDPEFTLTAVLNEGMLWREIGGTEVMREQLRSLVHMEHAARVDLHLVPFSAGAHPAQGQTVAILTFGDDDPDAVFADYGHAGAFLERPSEVRPLVSAFGGTIRAALSPEESRERIDKIAEQLGE